MAKNQTQKVTVRLYVPNGRQTIHGFPLTKPINVYRQIRKDKDGLPFIQYAGKQIYIARRIICMIVMKSANAIKRGYSP